VNILEEKPAAAPGFDQQPETDLGAHTEPTQLPTREPGDVVPIRPAPRKAPGRPKGSTSKRRNPPRRTDRPVLTPRISMFTTDAGKIDFTRTNDETVQKLAAAIQDPEAQRRLGLVDGAGAPVPPRSWAGMTSTLVDAVNAIGVQFAVNTWKLTDKQAELLLLRRDPETHRTVAQLTGEVLDKYFPGGFGAYDKEITLAIVLGGFVLNGVQQIQQMRAADALASMPTSMAA
jgi:hypothetical protein